MKYFVPLFSFLLFLACSNADTDKKTNSYDTNHESTGEYIDSSAITAKVKAKLVDDPITSAFRINVKTYKDVVQLSGFVNSYREKERAGELARSVAHVSSVKNNLVIK